MNKVKIALTVLSILITVGPFLGVVYVYRDNLSGLVVPPEVSSMINGNSNSTSSPIANFQPFMPVGNPTYDQQTGTFTYPFNFTNPLTNKISLDQLTADIYTENNVKLGTVSMNQPINIAPGETATINIGGSLSQDAINQYKTQYLTGGNVNISLENLNVTVGGVTLHIDQLPNVGQLQLPG